MEKGLFRVRPSGGNRDCLVGCHPLAAMEMTDIRVVTIADFPEGSHEWWCAEAHVCELVGLGGREIVLRKLPMGSIDADLLDLWVEVADGQD